MQQITIPLVGDVALVRGRSKRSKAIVALQTIPVGKTSPFSHVGLCVSNLVFIHATSERGVHLVLADEMFDSLTVADNWRVVRNRKLQEAIADDPGRRIELYKDAVYFLAQAYNKEFVRVKRGANEEDSSSFCSELVAKLYSRWGLPFSDGAPSRTYPGHIDRVTANEAEWLDVTNQYKTLMFDPRWAEIYHNFKRDASFSKDSLESIVSTGKEQEATSAILVRMGWLTKDDVDTRFKESPLKFWFSKFGTGRSNA